MGRGLGCFLATFDRDPEPEGFQLTDEPLRLRELLGRLAAL